MSLNFLQLLRVMVLSTLVAVTGAGQVPDQAPNSRTKLPNISLVSIDGERWELERERGKVVVLNFWATWCAPCRTEVPFLVRLFDEKRDQGLSVVGIALDNDNPLVRKFMSDYKINYPILIPEAGSPFMKLENTPTTLLIDRNGALAQNFIGAVPEAELRRNVEKLLKDN